MKNLESYLIKFNFFAVGFVSCMVFVKTLPETEDRTQKVAIEKQVSIQEKVAAQKPKPEFDIEKLLDAIKQVESGGDSEAVGDAGRALGAYQIWDVYFQDAVEFDATLNDYEYHDVKREDVARRVVKAYWNRYATERGLGNAPTMEQLARIHNGGPNGHKKQATIKYWEKVRRELEK